MMEGVAERAACRGSLPASCGGYSMNRFLSRPSPFADCMQGYGAPYAAAGAGDWEMMHPYAHSLPPHSVNLDRGAAAFRSSAASGYYPLSHGKDSAPPALYSPHSARDAYAPLHAGFGTTASCPPPSSPSPTSTRLSPDPDRKENRGDY
jgi:hypothetical protein